MFLQKLNPSQIYYSTEGKTTKNYYWDPKIKNQIPTQQTNIQIVALLIVNIFNNNNCDYHIGHNCAALTPSNKVTIQTYLIYT